MYCQIFSCGLSSGLFDGIGMIEILSGILSLGVRCQPAWSMSTTAKAAASIAIESVVTDEPWDGSCSDPETRRARVPYAAWFVLLAGIDEEGIDRDLDCAAELFYTAAMA